MLVAQQEGTVVVFPLIKLAKKLKVMTLQEGKVKPFPLIKLAKKLKGWFSVLLLAQTRRFPLIKLAKKLKALLANRQ